MRLKVPVVPLKVWFLPLSWTRNRTRPSCLLTQRHKDSKTTGSLCSYDQKVAQKSTVHAERSNPAQSPRRLDVRTRRRSFTGETDTLTHRLSHTTQCFQDTSRNTTFSPAAEAPDKASSRRSP